jgi:hypothetical protein
MPTRRFSDPPFVMRHPDRGDLDRLAELMLDSYIGTIDYEGEGIDEAHAEVTDYLDAEPLLDSSWVLEDGDLFLAAILISIWGDGPLVGFVMTRGAAKGHHVAATLLERSLESLREAGWTSVDAFITEGNAPSERLFASAGAVKVG